MKKNIKEIWTDVKNFEGYYQVSNLGRIKSLQRICIRSNGVAVHYKEKILNPSVDECGYLHVRLAINSNYTLFKVHRLVAMHFLNDYDEKLTVNHINHNRWDNSVNNLEMMDFYDNIKDRSVKRRIYCVELDRFISQPHRFFNRLKMEYSRYYFLKAIELKKEYNGFHFKYMYE